MSQPADDWAARPLSSLSTHRKAEARIVKSGARMGIVMREMGGQTFRLLKALGVVVLGRLRDLRQP